MRLRRRSSSSAALRAMPKIHARSLPRLVSAVLDAGGEIYVWTVDDPKRIEHLRGLGVTGCISNDPRLLAVQPRMSQVPAE